MTFNLPTTKPEYINRCLLRLSYVFPEFEFDYLDEKIHVLSNSVCVGEKEKTEIGFIIYNEFLSHKFENMRIEIMKTIFNI